ncbi:AMP-binding protein [Lutibacter sp. B1]|uniref:AMP-binding protein n=1 Tax=Lutibacter sp. B1 TaxID=2725996 RepID=UPI001456B5F1|nr:AMP-binding protein [Lutibacter sp. B1]NLP56742.1 AMP-binding protein [Lutibacter sp. B1]
MYNNQFHKSFQLQGKSFKNSQEIINFSKEISVEVFTLLEQWFSDNSFVEVKTSGSTGIPKIIQLEKEFMVNSAKATGEYFSLFENTSALLCMSPNYIAGKMMLVRALTLGWSLDIVEPTSNPLKNCEKQYDFSAMVPIQLSNSINEIHQIKKLIVGGGVVSKELLSLIQNIETEVFATFGMTETITHIAVKKLNNMSHAKLVSASHYYILPNISISTDNRGCLVINAPKIAKEQIVTNDLVDIISEKEFKWLGRFDTIINSGGIKLIPEQIEEKLEKIIDTRFFVAGLPDAILGEKLILVIENVQNSISKEAIFTRICNLQTLSKFEIPKEIYLVNEFIETATGKINRKEIINILDK